MLTPETLGVNAPDQIEVTTTPFISQQRYQCGPAALASVLQHSGVDISDDELVPQIYLPERQGSLQVELLAASRRYNRIPYVIKPDIQSLAQALQDDYPVIVLQNLGLRGYPAWHYAVVIGYSRADDQIVLRSGTQRRLTMSVRHFLRTWRASDNWGMIPLRPGDIPASADSDRYLAALAAMETVADSSTLQTAYASALERWPGNTSALFGLAGTLHAQGKLSEAQQRYIELLALRADHIPALNNLAELYADRGCRALAANTIKKALSLNNGKQPLDALLLETRDRIMADPPTAGQRVTTTDSNCL
ncbi:MAG: PA2778 family cysteine peptidase [Thiogranum sp.]|nr:PA2778 family cysteine peptidase [Thiogranum sp.]